MRFAFGHVQSFSKTFSVTLPCVFSTASAFMPKRHLERGCGKVWKSTLLTLDQEIVAEASFLAKLKTFNFSFHYCVWDY